MIDDRIRTSAMVESVWRGMSSLDEGPVGVAAGMSPPGALLSSLPEENRSTEAHADLLLTLGILQWRKGEHQRADEFLREALEAAAEIQDDGFEAECFNALALVKTSMGKIDEAIEAYKQAIRLAPKPILAWNNLGNLCARLSRHDEAIAAFQKALECDGRDPVSWNGLAGVYLKQGNAEEAIDAYRKSIQYLPGFAQAWNGLADAYMAAGSIEDAREAYHRAIELNGRLAAPWFGLGRMLKRQARHREAIEAYQAGLHLEPGYQSGWKELGSIYLRCEWFEDAARAFSKAIELDSLDGRSFKDLAVTFAVQGKYEEAVPLYRKSLELLNGGEASTWNRLADAYRMLDDYDRAMAAYHMAEVIDSNPSNRGQPEDPGFSTSTIRIRTVSSEADSPRGAVDASAFEDAGRMEAAAAEAPAPEAAAATQSTTDAPLDSPPSAPVQEGATMEKIEQLAGAIPDEPVAPAERPTEPGQLEEIQIDSKSAEIWNVRGNAHFRQGAVDEAIEEYNEAIKLDPAFGWPYCNLALAYLTRGQYAEALLLYQRSLELLDADRDRAVSWNGLGNVYRCIGDYANAVTAYQKAAELDPATAGMRDGADYFRGGQYTNNAQAWNDLGEAFLKTGAYDEAIKALNKAIDLEPERGWPYCNLASVLAALGQYDKAVQFYSKGIALLESDKEKATVWNRLGNAYRKLNDYDNAIKAYQKAVVLADEGVTLLSRTRFSLLSNCDIDA